MPKFNLNKLVRDKLLEDYKRLNQKVGCRELTKSEHSQALINKIIEEVHEINIDDSAEDMSSEVADIMQVLEDYIKLNDLSLEKIEQIKRQKFDKKGGFIDGSYVNTIELTEDDEWVKYYREHPDIFPEL